MDIGSKNIGVVLALSIAAGAPPVLTNLAFEGTSTSCFGTTDIVDLIDTIAGGTSSLAAAIPLLELCPVEPPAGPSAPLRVKFAAQDTPTLDAGLALSGALYVDTNFDGFLDKSPGSPELIAVVDIELVLGFPFGLRFFASIPQDIDLVLVTLSDPEIDVELDAIPPRASFIVRGDLDYPWGTERIDVPLTGDGLVLAIEDALNELLMIADEWALFVEAYALDQLGAIDDFLQTNQDVIAFLDVNNPEWLGPLFDALAQIQAVLGPSTLLGLDAVLNGIPLPGIPGFDVPHAHVPDPHPVIHSIHDSHTILHVHIRDSHSTVHIGHDKHTTFHCHFFLCSSDSHPRTHSNHVIPHSDITTHSDPFHIPDPHTTIHTPLIHLPDPHPILHNGGLFDLPDLHCAPLTESGGKCYLILPTTLPGICTLFGIECDVDGLLDITISGALNDGAVDVLSPFTEPSNRKPRANAGGPYFVGEGGSVILSAGRSTDPDGDPLTFSWGLDGNPTGRETIFSAAGLSGPLTINFGLTVSDGELSATTAGRINIVNALPAVDISGASEVPEGDIFLGSGFFVDPGADTWSAIVDYGDGTEVGALALNPNKTFALSHVYADDETYTVTVTVTDDDDGVGTDSLQVLVTNVAPTVDAGDDQTVDEGSVVSLDPATFNDKGTLDIHTATINWGDGGPVEAGTLFESSSGPPGNTLGTDGSVSSTHVYADDGVYNVIVCVTDDDHDPDGVPPVDGQGCDTLTVTVSNVAPTVDPGEDQTADEGAEVHLNPATFNDKGTLDTHTATINWGDGTGTEAGTVTESPFGPPGDSAGADGTVDGTHVYADNGSYPVTVCVRDDDFALVDPVCDTLVMTVSNAFPTVNASPGQTVDASPGQTVDEGPDQTVDEGETVNLAPAIFNDLGTLDTHTATIDWGDGSAVHVGVVTEAPFGPPGDTAGMNGTVGGSHAYGDNGSYTVTVCVKDDDLSETCDTLTVAVDNVAPTLGPITGLTSDAVQVDTTVIASATFTDPGFDNALAPTEENFTVTIDWGDGTIEVGPPGGSITLVEIAGSEGVLTTGTIQATHAYSSAGIYTVKLTVTDDDTGSDTSVYQFMVVFDPDAGFVTGGGWIDSPDGECQLTPVCENATGKASFDILSKYPNGKIVPQGNTGFKFKAGKLDFSSSKVYEWMVVSGARAQYKGTGTVNKGGSYGFLLTVIDGSLDGSGVDKFRLRIWDEDKNDLIVYDNQNDADLDAAPESDLDVDPNTAISQGSIVIHKGKK